MIVADCDASFRFSFWKFSLSSFSSFQTLLALYKYASRESIVLASFRGVDTENASLKEVATRLVLLLVGNSDRTLSPSKIASTLSNLRIVSFSKDSMFSLYLIIRVIRLSNLLLKHAISAFPWSGSELSGGWRSAQRLCGDLGS